MVLRRLLRSKAAYKHREDQELNRMSIIPTARQTMAHVAVFSLIFGPATDAAIASAATGDPGGITTFDAALLVRIHAPSPQAAGRGADMQVYFRVSPPSVHQMVLTLEREGFIRRQPRAPRSIELLVDPRQLPELL